MKKYILIFLAVAGLTSCSDVLDKELDTEATLEEVFQSKNQQERWLGFCYSKIEKAYGDKSLTWGWDAMADDQAPSERWQTLGWNTLVWRNGNINTLTWWQGNYWSECYQHIRQCLIFQKYASPVPSEGLSASEVALMRAETRFLIALYYWYLIDTYGPVPFTPGGYLVPTNYDLNTLMESPKPWDTIVDWIDQELLEVSKILPASYSNASKYGRATSIMCLAVRARILLFNASPLVNGNPDYANHVNKEGEHLFPQTYDPEKWTRAADACRLLIETAHAAGHKLYYVYNSDGSIDPFSSCQLGFFVTNATDNKEILFARVADDYDDYNRSATTAALNGDGGLGVTQEYVDAHFMKNGLPIDDPDSGYVEEGYSTTDDIRKVDWEFGEPVAGDKHSKNIAHAGTWNMYVNREPRFYCDVQYHGAWQAYAQRYLDFVKGHTDNSGNYNSPQYGYLMRKRVDPIYNPNPYSSRWHPGILYRLAEAYLNYAEALNEAGGPASEVLSYLNKVRERAGIRGYTTGATDDKYIHVDNNKDAIRKVIWMERRIELSCEGGLRYEDLRRWKECENLLNDCSMHGMNANATTQADFLKRVASDSKRVYKKALYWLPIRQVEIDKNPNLVQSPFWDITTGE